MSWYGYTRGANPVISMLIIFFFGRLFSSWWMRTEKVILKSLVDISNSSVGMLAPLWFQKSLSVDLVYHLAARLLIQDIGRDNTDVAVFWWQFMWHCITWGNICSGHGQMVTSRRQSLMRYFQRYASGEVDVCSSYSAWSLNWAFTTVNAWYDQN